MRITVAHGPALSGCLQGHTRDALSTRGQLVLKNLASEGMDPTKGSRVSHEAQEMDSYPASTTTQVSVPSLTSEVGAV